MGTLLKEDKRAIVKLIDAKIESLERIYEQNLDSGMYEACKLNYEMATYYKNIKRDFQK